MSGRRYEENIKEKVAILRSQGNSYAEIQKTFPIPKSTLSVWLGEKYSGIFDRKAQLAHLKKIRISAAAAKTAGRLQRETAAFERAKKIAENTPLQDIGVLKSLLAMLYWAEGTKFDGATGVRFVNTDPQLIQLYLSLLRATFPIDESKLKVRVHLHYYHHKKETVAFWSEITSIPTSQFGKLYVKRRSKTKKFRKNFMGICFIYYPGEAMRKEIMQTGKEISAILCHQ